MLVGDFNSRFGKVGQLDDIAGQYGEEKRNMVRVEMLKFFKNYER